MLPNILQQLKSRSRDAISTIPSNLSNPQLPHAAYSFTPTPHMFDTMNMLDAPSLSSLIYQQMPFETLFFPQREITHSTTPPPLHQDPFNPLSNHLPTNKGSIQHHKNDLSDRLPDTIPLVPEAIDIDSILYSLYPQQSSPPAPSPPISTPESYIYHHHNPNQSPNLHSTHSMLNPNLEHLLCIKQTALSSISFLKDREIDVNPSLPSHITPLTNQLHVPAHFSTQDEELYNPLIWSTLNHIQLTNLLSQFLPSAFLFQHLHNPETILSLLNTSTTASSPMSLISPISPHAPSNHHCPAPITQKSLINQLNGNYSLLSPHLNEFLPSTALVPNRLLFARLFDKFSILKLNSTTKPLVQPTINIHSFYTHLSSHRNNKPHTAQKSMLEAAQFRPLPSNSSNSSLSLSSKVSNQPNVTSSTTLLWTAPRVSKAAPDRAYLRFRHCSTLSAENTTQSLSLSAEHSIPAMSPKQADSSMANKSKAKPLSKSSKPSPESVESIFQGENVLNYLLKHAENDYIRIYALMLALPHTLRIHDRYMGSIAEMLTQFQCPTLSTLQNTTHNQNAYNMSPHLQNSQNISQNLQNSQNSQNPQNQNISHKSQNVPQNLPNLKKIHQSPNPSNLPPNLPHNPSHNPSASHNLPNVPNAPFITYSPNQQLLFYFMLKATILCSLQRHIQYLFNFHYLSIQQTIYERCQAQNTIHQEYTMKQSCLVLNEPKSLLHPYNQIDSFLQTRLQQAALAKATLNQNYQQFFNYFNSDTSSLVPAQTESSIGSLKSLTSSFRPLDLELEHKLMNGVVLTNETQYTLNFGPSTTSTRTAYDWYRALELPAFGIPYGAPRLYSDDVRFTFPTSYPGNVVFAKSLLFEEDFRRSQYRDELATHGWNERLGKVIPFGAIVGLDGNIIETVRGIDTGKTGQIGQNIKIQSTSMDDTEGPQSQSGSHLPKGSSFSTESALTYHAQLPPQFIQLNKIHEYIITRDQLFLTQAQDQFALLSTTFHAHFDKISNQMMLQTNELSPNSSQASTPRGNAREKKRTNPAEIRIVDTIRQNLQQRHENSTKNLSTNLTLLSPPQTSSNLADIDHFDDNCLTDTHTVMIYDNLSQNSSPEWLYSIFPTTSTPLTPTELRRLDFSWRARTDYLLETGFSNWQQIAPPILTASLRRLGFISFSAIPTQHFLPSIRNEIIDLGQLIFQTKTSINQAFDTLPTDSKKACIKQLTSNLNNLDMDYTPFSPPNQKMKQNPTNADWQNELLAVSNNFVFKQWEPYPVMLHGRSLFHTLQQYYPIAGTSLLEHLNGKTPCPAHYLLAPNLIELCEAAVDSFLSLDANESLHGLNGMNRSDQLAFPPSQRRLLHQHFSQKSLPAVSKSKSKSTKHEIHPDGHKITTQKRQEIIDKFALLEIESILSPQCTYFPHHIGQKFINNCNQIISHIAVPRYSKPTADLSQSEICDSHRSHSTFDQDNTVPFSHTIHPTHTLHNLPHSHFHSDSDSHSDSRQAQAKNTSFQSDHSQSVHSEQNRLFNASSFDTQAIPSAHLTVIDSIISQQEHMLQTSTRIPTAPLLYQDRHRHLSRYLREFHEETLTGALTTSSSRALITTPEKSNPFTYSLETVFKYYLKSLSQQAKPPQKQSKDKDTNTSPITPPIIDFDVKISLEHPHIFSDFLQILHQTINTPDEFAPPPLPPNITLLSTMVKLLTDLNPYNGETCSFQQRPDNDSPNQYPLQSVCPFTTPDILIAIHTMISIYIHSSIVQLFLLVETRMKSQFGIDMFTAIEKVHKIHQMNGFSHFGDLLNIVSTDVSENKAVHEECLDSSDEKSTSALGITNSSFTSTSAPDLSTDSVDSFGMQCTSSRDSATIYENNENNSPNLLPSASGDRFSMLSSVSTDISAHIPSLDASVNTLSPSNSVENEQTSCKHVISSLVHLNPQKISTVVRSYLNLVDPIDTHQISAHMDPIYPPQRYIHAFCNQIALHSNVSADSPLISQQSTESSELNPDTYIINTFEPHQTFSSNMIMEKFSFPKPMNFFFTLRTSSVSVPLLSSLSSQNLSSISSMGCDTDIIHSKNIQQDTLLDVSNNSIPQLISSLCLATPGTLYIHPTKTIPQSAIQIFTSFIIDFQRILQLHTNSSLNESDKRKKKSTPCSPTQFCVYIFECFSRHLEHIPLTHSPTTASVVPTSLTVPTNQPNRTISSTSPQYTIFTLIDHTLLSLFYSMQSILPDAFYPRLMPIFRTHLNIAPLSPESIPSPFLTSPPISLLKYRLGSYSFESLLLFSLARLPSAQKTPEMPSPHHFFEPYFSPNNYSPTLLPTQRTIQHNSSHSTSLYSIIGYIIMRYTLSHQIQFIFNLKKIFSLHLSTLSMHIGKYMGLQRSLLTWCTAIAPTLASLCAIPFSSFSSHSSTSTQSSRSLSSPSSHFSQSSSGSGTIRIILPPYYLPTENVLQKTAQTAPCEKCAKMTEKCEKSIVGTYDSILSIYHLYEQLPITSHTTFLSWFIAEYQEASPSIRSPAPCLFNPTQTLSQTEPSNTRTAFSGSGSSLAYIFTISSPLLPLVLNTTPSTSADVLHDDNTHYSDIINAPNSHSHLLSPSGATTLSRDVSHCQPDSSSTSHTSLAALAHFYLLLQDHLYSADFTHITSTLSDFSTLTMSIAYLLQQQQKQRHHLPSPSSLSLPLVSSTSPPTSTQTRAVLHHSNSTSQPIHTQPFPGTIHALNDYEYEYHLFTQLNLIIKAIIAHIVGYTQLIHRVVKILSQFIVVVKKEPLRPNLTSSPLPDLDSSTAIMSNASKVAKTAKTSTTFKTSKTAMSTSINALHCIHHPPHPDAPLHPPTHISPVPGPMSMSPSDIAPFPHFSPRTFRTTHALLHILIYTLHHTLDIPMPSDLIQRRQQQQQHSTSHSALRTAHTAHTAYTELQEQAQRQEEASEELEHPLTLSTYISLELLLKKMQGAYPLPIAIVSPFAFAGGPGVGPGVCPGVDASSFPHRIPPPLTSMSMPSTTASTPPTPPLPLSLLQPPLPHNNLTQLVSYLNLYQEQYQTHVLYPLQHRIYDAMQYIRLYSNPRALCAYNTLIWFYKLIDIYHQHHPHHYYHHHHHLSGLTSIVNTTEVEVGMEEFFSSMPSLRMNDDTNEINTTIPTPRPTSTTSPAAAATATTAAIATTTLSHPHFNQITALHNFSSTTSASVPASVSTPASNTLLQALYYYLTHIPIESDSSINAIAAAGEE